MSAITIPVGRGTATGIDPSLTDRLQESVGVVYEPGDPAAHKIGGRTVLNETPIAADSVRSINFVDAGNVELIAAVGDDVYVVSPSTGVSTDVADLTTASNIIDVVGFNNVAYLVSGNQADDTAPFGAHAIHSGTAYRMGLYGVLTAVTAVVGAGPGMTGTYQYWTTEYDSTNNIESSYDLYDLTGGVAGLQPINQSADLTKPTTYNATADKWRIYRTIDGGTFPIGWLVTELPIATTTYNDTTTDADLVLNEPYRIVTVNGIPESMDKDPQNLALSSISVFQGSLIGTTVVGGDFAWTPAEEPHSWPDSYRITFPTIYGGNSVCTRACGDSAYVMFANETFMVNYLPDESDSVFDTNICVERVANYGTPSPIGACTFTGWGGQPVLFVPSLHGPIVISGRAVDRAVKAIDWTGLVSLGLGYPNHWKSIDNPDKWRVEFYYQDDADDASSWKCLHFYYDSERSVNTGGPLPEMSWTGPHGVPGPGTYGFVNNTPTVWTASAAGDGLVYVENTGTVDEAHLFDSDGTIPFVLRTNRVYPHGIDAEARADRLFIHKNGGSDQDFDVTFNAHRENGSSKSYPNITIAATGGVSSNSLNANLVSLDVQVEANGVDGMAPINNITVRLRDEKNSALKTVTA